MNKLIGGLMLMTTVLLYSEMETQAQPRERDQVPVQYTWNVQDIYPTDDAWKKSKDDFAAKIPNVADFKGKVTASAVDLLACLKFNSDMSKEFVRLFSYTSLKSDQDTRNSQYLGMKQEISQLATNFSSQASYIEPEILQLDKQQIDQFITQEPALKEYKMYLYDLLRKKTHRLSDKEEKIIAEASLMAAAPSSIYQIFSNAELPYPTIKLSDGSDATLDASGYVRYRALPNRDDREKVFQSFWTTMNDFRRTFGEQLYGQVKKDMFYARVRGYESSLASALDDNNIPTEVYLKLIENVNNNLATFHRYLTLKKQMLGVDTLKYSDLYPSVVKGIDLKYNYDQAKALVLDAFKPLGKDYVAVVEQAFDKRWIDVYPTTAKRSGAYSSGSVYDVHPYILLNYNGLYDDVSTLAHELGHTMHSYYSNKTQPYPTADYSIFVAEVASTLNESLLINKMFREIKEDDTQLSLLMNYLDNIKGTVFRQTQFAEFEVRIHETAERGEPLTGDVLNKIYGDILKKYYGHDQNICYIDDLYSAEWTYIPHFYYNFYVYQYSTSFTASIALSEKILSQEKGAVANYINFLSSGGSDYPIELLKKAGVDMTTPEPFNKTMAAMNRTMYEIEKILKKKKK
jgi:oligoendopeptidase F